MKHCLHEVIAFNIRACRKAQGLSMLELAEKSDVSWRTIQNAEAGSAEMRVTTFAKIADGLGVKPAYLINSSAIEARDVVDVAVREMMEVGNEPVPTA